MDVLGRMVLAGLGDRPLIFVTHSLGGLVVKQMLGHAKEMRIDDWRPIADATRGIVFLGDAPRRRRSVGLLAMPFALSHGRQRPSATCRPTMSDCAN